MGGPVEIPATAVLNSGARIPFANVWEEIFAHAAKRKTNGVLGAAAGDL